MSTQCAGDFIVAVSRKQHGECRIAQQAIERGNLFRRDSHRSGLLPQQRIATGAMKPIFREEHIERERRHVVRNRIHGDGVFLIDDLAIAVAFITGLGAHRNVL